MVQRATLDRIWRDLRQAAVNYEPLWREIDDLLPHRARFEHSEARNRGVRRTPLIVDGAALHAHLIARSGLLAGLASPADPWFDLTPVRPALRELQHVKEWMRRARDILLSIFDRSNIYAGLEMNFGDQLGWGTGSMLLLPDDEDIIRAESLVPGTYYLGQDHKGRPDKLARSISMPARQMVQKFGEHAVSDQVRSQMATGFVEAHPIEVRHVIIPVETRTGRSWMEVYWEVAGSSAPGMYDYEFSASDVFGGTSDGILRIGMFRTNPIVAARWERNYDEVWGARWPMRSALGDVLELQSMRKAYLSVLAEHVAPAVVAGPGNEQTVVQNIAGGKTVDPNMTNASAGMRELRSRRAELDKVWQPILDKREMIGDHFFVKLFLNRAAQQRTAQPVTAEQIIQERRETATVLSPIKERQADELLDPVVTRSLSMLIERSEPFWAQRADGILPLPPEELLGEPLPRVRYVSDIAAIQRASSFSGTERWLGIVSQLAPLDARVLDVPDFDEILQLHADANGVAPSAVRTDEEIAEIRQMRAQQQAAQQQAEMLPEMANAGKALSEARVGDSSLLEELAAGAAQ